MNNNPELTPLDEILDVALFSIESLERVKTMAVNISRTNTELFHRITRECNQRIGLLKQMPEVEKYYEELNKRAQEKLSAAEDDEGGNSTDGSGNDSTDGADASTPTDGVADKLASLKTKSNGKVTQHV